MAGKHGLGRGLSSLIPQNKTTQEHAARTPQRVVAPSRSLQPQRRVEKTEVVENEQEEKTASVKPQGAHEVSVGSVVENTQQPRMYFNQEKLDELADSIREHGIIQPLTVVTKGDGYELIAGERRLRAAKQAGLKHVPVVVRDETAEQQKLELAIIENVQRHDLNVIEEGKSYKKLADDFDLSQDEIARKMGKSRSAIANRMRLAKLPVEIQRGLIDGKITEGHAKVILSLDNPEKQRGLFDMITSQKLSVRDAERALTKGSVERSTEIKSHARTKKTPQEKVLEDQLSAYFQTKVNLVKKGGGGEVRIQYLSEEDIKNILGKLTL